MEVLRDPQKHFARAVELSERSKILAIRAKEASITSKVVAAELAKNAALDAHFAVYHVALGFQALALLKKFTAASANSSPFTCN